MYKFKIGDEVICFPGFDSSDSNISSGGAGYISGKIFIITDITKSSYDNEFIAWDNNEGVYLKAIRLFHITKKCRIKLNFLK